MRPAPPEPVRDPVEERPEAALVFELPGLGERAERGYHQDHVLATLIHLLTEEEALQDRVARAVPVLGHPGRRLRPLDVVAAQEHDQVDGLFDPVVVGDEHAGGRVVHARHVQGDRQVQRQLRRGGLPADGRVRRGGGARLARPNARNEQEHRNGTG
jgi:hypothetical protein